MIFFFFLAVLDLCCCSQVFSSYREHGLLFVVILRLPFAGLLMLQSMGSRARGQ